MSHRFYYFGRVFSTLFLATVLALLVPLPIVKAQDKVSTAITPIIFELTANPGDTLEKTVKVTNAGDTLTAYTMDIEPFVGNETGQATITATDDPTYSLKSWVTIKPATFNLKSKESQFVVFTIKVPGNAEPGGRYGSILASAGGGDSVNGTGAITKQKVGSLILVSVAGDVSYSATIKNFGADKRLFERSPIGFTTRLHNDSTVHVKPKGFITIANLFGKKVADVPFDEKNILPKSDRLITSNYATKLPIGRYTATLSLVYGEKGDQLTSVSSFIVFPWKVGLPIVAVILILIWFLIARRRQFFQALRIIFGKNP